MKLTVTQVVEKFPTMHEMERFITMFTKARNWFLSYARCIQSTPSQLASL